jgi:hypothetical protein
LRLFADYHQIHLFDEGSATGLGKAWTEQASHAQLAVDGDAMAVSTVVNVFVDVTVTVLPGQPSDDSTRFDHMVEGSLRTVSGRLVIMGCTDYEPDAARFAVPAGWLRVRVAKSNLAEAWRLGVNSDDEPGTMERIRIQVWPDGRAETIVLKQWHPPGT